jgi:hypothetical protein
MSSEDMKIIEINGIKMEIDTRLAKRVDNFRVGSKVKVLETSSYSGAKVFHGVVVGFDDFEKLPTIIVAYLDISYSESKLEFAYINKDTEKFELVLSVDDELPINRADVLTTFKKEKDKLQEQIAEVDRKESYFLRHFNMYFNDAELHETEEA